MTQREEIDKWADSLGLEPKFATEPVGHIYTINKVQHCTIEKELDDCALYTGSQLRAAIAQAQAANPWQQEVEEQVVITCGGPADWNNPKAMVDYLIDYHVDVALDPQVSSDAQALIDQGKAQAADRCRHGVWAADHCYQCDKEQAQAAESTMQEVATDGALVEVRRTNGFWQRYNIYDSVATADDTKARVDGPGLEVRVVPLYRTPPQHQAEISAPHAEIDDCHKRMRLALEALRELADCGAEAWSAERPCVKDGYAAIAALEGVL